MCYVAFNKRGAMKTIILALSLFCSNSFASDKLPHAYYVNDEGGEEIPILACSISSDTLRCKPAFVVSESDLENFLNDLYNSHLSAESRILSSRFGTSSFAALLILGLVERINPSGILGLSKWGNLALTSLSGILYAISLKGGLDARVHQHYNLLEEQVNSGLVGAGAYGEYYNRIFLERFAEFLEEHGRPVLYPTMESSTP